MPKVIVTHYSPDFDGIPAIWVLKKFHPDFADAEIKFSPAGETIDGKPAGSDPNVMHVDTGGGPFDHHESNKYTCAAELVWQWVKKEQKIKDQAVDRLMALIVAFDHAKDLSWPDVADDKYELLMPAIIAGWKIRYPGQYEKVVELGLQAMDAAYEVMKSKIAAEDEIKKKAIVFKTKWGKAIALETRNEAVLMVGEKIGYCLVVKKDPKRKNIRIYGRADKGINLTQVYKKVIKLEPQTRWFLHASKCLLLNGSAKNPKMVPTGLTLSQMVEIIGSVK